MKPPGRPLFLARQNYNARRVMDAARLLPIVGLFLVLMPLLWQADGGARSLTGQLVYLFGLWAGLIIVAYFLSDRLSRAEEEYRARPPTPPPTVPPSEEGTSDDQL